MWRIRCAGHRCRLLCACVCEFQRVFVLCMYVSWATTGISPHANQLWSFHFLVFVSSKRCWWWCCCCRCWWYCCSAAVWFVVAPTQIHQVVQYRRWLRRRNPHGVHSCWWSLEHGARLLFSLLAVLVVHVDYVRCQSATPPAVRVTSAARLRINARTHARTHARHARHAHLRMHENNAHSRNVRLCTRPRTYICFFGL